MYPSVRSAYNAKFSSEKYNRFLEDLNGEAALPIGFRIAETPIFLSNDFRDSLIRAGDDVIESILQPGFKQLTEKAIPSAWRVANENDHPHFIALDFGVCADENGQIVPKLIELQGFPSLYGFQSVLDEAYKNHFDVAQHWTPYFNGLDKSSYLSLLRKTILGPHEPGEVVLMDVNAPRQKTAIDFSITQKYIGTPVVSLSDLRQEGKALFYCSKDGKRRIKRIYNRLIFDEIAGDMDVFKNVVDIRQPLDVEWITHPNWFYRISKFTLPFLSGAAIPAARFLSELTELPAELNRYILKPLFSFAGQGVIIDVTKDDIENLKDRRNWILQEKVNYHPVVRAPDGMVKAEIRLMYLWPNGEQKPSLVINLARLSRGEMIGVRYNQDFDWVGGTIALSRR